MRESARAAAVSGALRADELARARVQLKSGLLMSREGTGNRCEQLAQHVLVYGRPVATGTHIRLRVLKPVCSSLVGLKRGSA